MDGTAEAAALVGRSRLVKDVTRSLLDDSRAGVLIVGAAGTGKTAVSKAVLRELPPGGSVIRLVATRALAAVPFGALAPYLSELPDSELDSFAAVLRALSERLRAETVRPLFVVDDAQFLDRGSTELLARAAAVGAAEILAASRPGPAIPEQFLALWDEGLLSKFELSPLNRSSVHELCKQVLGAEVSPWVSAVFADVSGGNPLMLMSLIEHERYTGALALRHGVWYLRANPDLAGVPAADVIDQQLRSMSPEERTAAAIVAMAGPLSLGQILRFSSPKTVDALEAAGILAVSQGHDRSVRAASPLLGEIIRHRAPPGLSATLRASLLELPSPGVVGPEAFLNQLRWSLECGAPVPPGQLLQAAATANMDLNPAAAIQAAHAVRDPRFLPEAKIQLAYAHYLLGRPAEAASYLTAAGSLPYGRQSYLAARLAARLPDGIDAWAGEREIYVPADDVDVDPSESSWSQMPPAAETVGILHGQWHGLPVDLEAGLQDLVDATAALPEIRLLAISLLGELRSAQGRLSAGLRLDREAWAGAISGDLTLPLAQEELVARHCLSLIRARDWEELAAVLDGYAAEYPSRLLYSGGMLHAMSGFALLNRGRILESLGKLILAVEELSIADPLEMLPFAHAAAGYAAVLAGHPGEAREQANAFDATTFRGPQSLRLLSEAYCITVGRLTSGDGLSEIEALADQAQHQGLRAVETDIRRLVLRNGDTGGAPALASSSSAVEGAEARLLSAVARAVAAADAAGLILISDEAIAAGHGLLAFEAAQQAAGFLEGSPDRWRLTAVQRRLHHLIVDAGISGQMQALRNEQGRVLTAREAEILELVATGSTNADVAAALSLSPRTVEGHLSRIFAKLGVSRRAELLEVRHESHHLTVVPEDGSELG